MNLYYSIIVAIWLAVLYAIWAATKAGDPGFGQAAFLAGGILATFYLRKRKRMLNGVIKKDITILFHFLRWGKCLKEMGLVF